MKTKLRKISASILLGTMLLYTLPVSAFTKEETVYSNTKSDGTKYNSIVSTHLKNTEEEEILKDMTEISTTLEEAYAYAKECDSRETLKRVLDCAQDPTKENMDLLKQMTTRKGGDKCK